jgi:Protein of unknown function (DUF2585)
MKKAPWLVLIAVLLAMTVAMRIQGRMWTCSCGYVHAWSGDINSADNSQQFLDPYTWTHVIHGFMFIGMMHLLWPHLNEVWKLVGALSLEALWEAIENTNYIINRYRSETIALGYTGDTILNSFGDVLACALGAILARRIGLVRTIGLAFLIEAILLIAVRDNLSLNIVMLLYPIDAIRRWQLGH